MPPQRGQDARPAEGGQSPPPPDPGVQGEAPLRMVACVYSRTHAPRDAARCSSGRAAEPARPRSLPLGWGGRQRQWAGADARPQAGSPRDAALCGSGRAAKAARPRSLPLGRGGMA